MVFKNGVKNIQAAAYNGALTVSKLYADNRKVMINISILTEQDSPKGTLVQWQDYFAEFAAFLSQWLFSKYLQCINLLHIRRIPNF